MPSAPSEVLGRLPDARTVFASVEGGPLTNDVGSLTLETAVLADELEPEIILVPGGPADAVLQSENSNLVDWLVETAPKASFVTSVCTGAILLGQAGLLKGLQATTHWVWLDKLKEYGAEPTLQRVVPQGKIVTAAGVSSGIDMALTLVEKIHGG